ncbi:GGDEF domain-containing protein [Actinoplanes sp. NPDC049265]|uniref:GGDEF domain-containing protein n=1 Tax=Actinoplanes sp. NPDC049265 TaxID=3363902 RepID=UPI003724225C
MRSAPKAAELVPVIDRYLWMAGCRVVVTVLLVTVLLTRDRAHGGHVPVVAGALGWLLLTLAVAPAARRSRRTARIGFTLGLLGDGLLLAGSWWILGAPGNVVELLVCAHVLGTTLLASFRTGVKVTLWHSVLAFTLLETQAVGLLGRPVPMPVAGLATYVGGLWLISILTACFASVNERELRRRRYDSEALRDLGLTLARPHPPRGVLRRLAAFARDDMLADRVAILVYPSGDTGEPAHGFGIVAGPGGEMVLGDLPPESMDHCVRTAVPRAPVRLPQRVDPAADPVLAGALPGAVRPILVPFVQDQLRGVVAVTRARPGARVERRMVTALEQAVLQAGLALERELLNARIRRAAETDALTGLANRRTAAARLDASVADGRPFALLMVDLDHFKRLNDTYGHQAGDDALRVAADVLRAHCRPGDLVARYGGEEFMVILGRSDRDAAFAHADRLCRAIAAAPSTVPITASIGLAMFPSDGGGEHAILAAADAALYRAKAAGRNRVLDATSAALPVLVPPTE